jgi:hypothetical protein
VSQQRLAQHAKDFLRPPLVIWRHRELNQLKHLQRHAPVMLRQIARQLRLPIGNLARRFMTIGSVRIENGAVLVYEINRCTSADSPEYVKSAS